MIRQAVAGSLALFTAAQNDDMNDDDDEQPPFIARFLLKKEELLGDLPWYYLVGAVVIALWVTRKLLKCIRRHNSAESRSQTDFWSQFFFWRQDFLASNQFLAADV